MRELSLHLLDIAENSVAAGAHAVTITVIEDLDLQALPNYQGLPVFLGDRLYMAVQDDGKGMDAASVARVTDPFVTSRTTRKVGLGLPLLKEAAEMCNGFLRITSEIDKGTLVEVEFQHSHIDRMPLGDLAETLFDLLISSPEIHWIFKYRVGCNEVFHFDDAPIKAELDGVPLTEPSILAFLHEMIFAGVANAQPVTS